MPTTTRHQFQLHALRGTQRVGIDLAKNVFAVHGVDASGSVLLRQPKVARAKLNALVVALPPCTIGIKA